MSELEAANDQLQLANERILASNRELRRTNEESKCLLASLRIPLVVVDVDLKILKIASESGSPLGVEPSDVGLSVVNVVREYDLPDLKRLVLDVVQSGKCSQVTLADRKGMPCLLRILPYIAPEGLVTGAILIFAAAPD